MGIALALAAAVVYGTGDFMGGLAARRSPVLTVLAGSQALGLLGILVVSLLTGGSPSGADMIAGAAGGITGGVGVALLYLALAGGEMALAAPVTGVVAAVLPVVVGLATGERPSALQGAGISAAVLAVLLLSGGMQRGAVRLRRRPLVYAVGSGAAFAAFYIALARASPAAGMWPLVFARCASLAMFGVTLAALRQAPRAHRGDAWLIAGTGAFDVGANALYLLAVHRSLLSIAAVLVSLYPAATAACAIGFLRERLTLPQGVGVLVALGAVTMVTTG